jgi:2-polyprenyl-3-methyl-5-hydroxy-6-metoxy-1,4-benzoquinol methylase
VGKPAKRKSTPAAARAALSRGMSGQAVYEMVIRSVDDILEGRGAKVLVDVGCGGGDLFRAIGRRFGRRIGIDAVRYKSLPKDCELIEADLDGERIPLPDGKADLVTAVEVIEHLENPRAFVRELVRLAGAGGWVLITTPNQLSLLSKASLVVKNHFNAFLGESYPAHRTALVELDLRRIAFECGLADVKVEYSLQGRIPFTPRHYPRWVSRIFPRALSDNLLIRGRKR